MDLNFGNGLSLLAVAAEGLLSFFSPCILPLLPVYFGYLSGGEKKMDEEGRAVYDRGRVLLHTLCFVLGISFTFALLGMGMTGLGRFLRGNQRLFQVVGGFLLIGMGILQFLIYSSGSSWLGRIPGIRRLALLFASEKKLPVQVARAKSSPLTAFLYGLVFSFAWTPCVGPALSSVLVMTATSHSPVQGLILIAVYTAGFVVPFLLVGIFTTSLLDLFRRHKNIVRYTAQIGAVLILTMGIWMVTGMKNPLAGADQGGDMSGQASTAASADQGESPAEGEKAPSARLYPAEDFTLTDQFGREHSLSDYKGKTIFLNFWATWCPPCRSEMPDIQALYEEYSAGVNADKDPDNDIVILGVAAPSAGEEKDQEGITAFLEEMGYDYPVLMDVDGSVFGAYQVTALPTTFMIDREGNLVSYVPGAMPRETMERLIESAE